MQRFLLLLLALSTASYAQAREPEREFVDRVLPRLREALPDAVLEPQADEPLAISVNGAGDWDGSVINLHRIYGYCQEATPEDCAAVIDGFADRVTGERAAPTADKLRVLVRDSEYMSYIFEEIPKEEWPPYKRIGEDLFAILAFDGEATIELAQPKKLAELELQEAAAWPLAEEQTRAILPPLPTAERLAEGAIAYQEFEYLPSMLNDTARWQTISEAVGSDLFVTAVSEHFVFVGIMPDGTEFENFKQVVAEDCRNQERCVSPNVYRFRGGQWVVAR